MTKMNFNKIELSACFQILKKAAQQAAQVHGECPGVPGRRWFRQGETTIFLDRSL